MSSNTLIFPPQTPRLRSMEQIRAYLIQLQGTVSTDDRRSHAILRKGIEHVELDMLTEVLSDDPNNELAVALRASARLELIEQRVSDLSSSVSRMKAWEEV